MGIQRSTVAFSWSYIQLPASSYTYGHIASRRLPQTELKLPRHTDVTVELRGYPQRNLGGDKASLW